MSAVPKTAFAGGNPWTGLGDGGTSTEPKPAAKKPAAKKPHRTITPVHLGVPRADVAAMKVVYDMPLPTGRDALADGGMYAELLKDMRPGGCIICKTEEVYAVASALRVWIKRAGKAKVWSVRTQTKWPEERGKGRVWCWPEPPPLKGKR